MNLLIPMKLLFENLVLNNLHGNPVQFITNASCREQSVFTEKLPPLMEWRGVNGGLSCTAVCWWNAAGS